MTWVLLWKIVLIAALAGFAGLAIVTTIGGALDIRRMLRRLEARDGSDATEASDDSGGDFR